MVDARRGRWVVLGLGLLGVSCSPTYLVDAVDEVTVSSGSVPDVPRAYGFDIFDFDADPSPLPTIESISFDRIDEGLEVEGFFVVDRSEDGVGAGSRAMLCELPHVRVDGPVALEGMVERLREIQVVALVSASEPGVYAAEGLRVSIDGREGRAGHTIRLEVFDPATRSPQELATRRADDRPCDDPRG